MSIQINPTMCKGIKTMTENKLQNKINKIRKVMITKSQYQLPDIDDDQFILDDEYEQEQEESTNMWLDSLSDKSQYDITENLCVNWQHIGECFTPYVKSGAFHRGGWGGCPYIYIKSGAFSVYTKAMVLLGYGLL